MKNACDGGDGDGGGGDDDGKINVYTKLQKLQQPEQQQLVCISHKMLFPLLLLLL